MASCSPGAPADDFDVQGASDRWESLPGYDARRVSEQLVPYTHARGCCRAPNHWSNSERWREGALGATRGPVRRAEIVPGLDARRVG